MHFYQISLNLIRTEAKNVIANLLSGRLRNGEMGGGGGEGWGRRVTGDRGVRG
jgi:hypothetical protein